ncbi:MAG: hypothetical protein EOQ50_29890 [Mesorhizobium sp.]|uniref:hypothetical protein n=1 Tax=Mesorhizobium sp. TaxID=1871066 RepID=UPI000FE99CF5|nr:hypothetical protein [Mesorhizobium sp.]RWB68094.1 MAG: hypothetical protein EOQ50_29890 [Mesorhizobium sp.]
MRDLQLSLDVQFDAMQRIRTALPFQKSSHWTSIRAGTPRRGTAQETQPDQQWWFTLSAVGCAVRRLIAQWLVDGEVELVMSPRTVTALAGRF